MTFTSTKRHVLNRGVAPDAFLTEMVEWARTAPDDIFAPNSNADIYGKVKIELGPWEMDNRVIAARLNVPEDKLLPFIHRRAVMLEVMRVLAGFESEWNWNCGVDSTRKSTSTNENKEAGAWQVSYDSRNFDRSLRALLSANGIADGRSFQEKMKSNHKLAMEYVARLMRFTTKHNGPLFKGSERAKIQPGERGEDHSIYPWLCRNAVREFETLLQQ